MSSGRISRPLPRLCGTANKPTLSLPASVFTNDDDYVDTFYTVEETVTYTNLAGAGRNATASFTPFFLQPN